MNSPIGEVKLLVTSSILDFGFFDFGLEARQTKIGPCADL
jgi:hypothetical protein